MFKRVKDMTVQNRATGLQGCALQTVVLYLTMPPVE